MDPVQPVKTSSRAFHKYIVMAVGGRGQINETLCANLSLKSKVYCILRTGLTDWWTHRLGNSIAVNHLNNL